MSKDKITPSKEKPDKSGKKNTSLRLENKTLKALKKRAIDEDSSVQAIVESLIDLYLKKKIVVKKSIK